MIVLCLFLNLVFLMKRTFLLEVFIIFIPIYMIAFYEGFFRLILLIFMAFMGLFA
jgi:hypothetical protein